MAAVKFFKVSSLPGGTLESDAFYLVLNGDYAETYLTDHSGVAKMIGNTAMIEAIATAAAIAVAAPLAVADIAARDALTLTDNRFVFVADASTDTTVDSGAALYLWDDAAEDFIKVYEYESLDLVLSWSNITGKPSSSPSAIDAAVTASHSHSNKADLDRLSISSGALRVDGVNVDTKTTDWNANNW